MDIGWVISIILVSSIIGTVLFGALWRFLSNDYGWADVVAGIIAKVLAAIALASIAALFIYYLYTMTMVLQTPS